MLARVALSRAGMWHKRCVSAVAHAPVALGCVGRRAMSSGAKTYEVVVFGGNGFVGSQVCKSLVGMGLKVAAINRSGAPREKEDWMEGVDYIAADVFEPESWRSVMHGAVSVVAAIGGFGNYEFMKKVNGEANILVAEEAAAMGVERMVFVSASFPPFPATIPLRGYIEGKTAAEEVVREKFPSTHTILKPSVVYGSQKGAHPFIAGIRALGPMQDPLMSKTPLQNFSGLPVIGGVFLPWSPVEAVARAAAQGAVRQLDKATLGPHDIAKFK